MDNTSLAAIVENAINLAQESRRRATSGGGISPEVVGPVAAALITAALKDEKGPEIKNALLFKKS